MPKKRSSGSKLGAIAGLVITLAFFLPWVRSCGVDMSGYDIATNKSGGVENSWVYWCTLLVGLSCMLLFFIFGLGNRKHIITLAIVRLFTALIGFIPLMNIYSNVKKQGELKFYLEAGSLY